jgi:molybdate transport system substrate-binding protein
MKHLLASSRPGEFGLGAITEIALFKDQGLKLVGPLPAAVQNYTSYLASVAAPPGTDPARSSAAAALLRFLDSPQARRIFADVGIEAATP